MGIGKESLITLESFARQQVRIWADSCDAGVWETPANRAAIRAALEGLRDLEGGVAERFHGGTAFRARLGIEMAADGLTVEGYEFRVSRCVVPPAQKRSSTGADAFYSIEIRRTQWGINERLGGK